MELLAACQGIDLLRPLKTSRDLEKIHRLLRAVVPKLNEDRVFHDDIIKTEELLRSPTLVRIFGRSK